MDMTRPAGIAVFFCAWAVSVCWNVGAFDRESARLKRWEPDLVALPKPEIIKPLVLGFDAVAADLYWVGGVHYFGDVKNQRVCFRELANYVDLVNYLAPDFKSAYRFGGMAIPCNRGDRWVNIEQACRILENGLRRFPDEWFFRLMLAYNYSSYLHRYRDAGDQLKLAALEPGAPRYMASLATRMYATEGDLDGASLIAREILRNTRDDELRAAMERRLQEIAVERQLHLLDDAIRKYREAHDTPPASLAKLVEAGLLAQIPAEALGGEFLYDALAGEVRSSSLKRRLELQVDR
jgi:hypothetical protein